MSPKAVGKNKLYVLLTFNLVYLTIIIVNKEERERIKSDSLLLKKVQKARKKMGQQLIWQEWMELDSIPELLRELVIIAEDGKFYEHNGFDLEQIEYALVSNHQQGKRARGASTISQQVIKNIFLTGRKKYSRKIREAVMTWLLEERLEKSQILELYLNIAQFGPGVFGVKAGARHHFNKPLDSLSLEETISLVALLPSPIKWNPHRKNNTYRKHRMRILRNLSLYKKIAHGIPDDRHELFLKYSQEEEEQRWSQLQTGPGDFSDSSDAPGDSTKGKKSIFRKFKFWGKGKKEETQKETQKETPEEKQEEEPALQE